MRFQKDAKLLKNVQKIKKKFDNSCTEVKKPIVRKQKRELDKLSLM